MERRVEGTGMTGETKKIILRGRKVIGGVAEGEALVTKMPLMGWGNVNAKKVALPLKGTTRYSRFRLKVKCWFSLSREGPADL